MTLRRKLRYHLQCLKQLISELKTELLAFNSTCTPQLCREPHRRWGSEKNRTQALPSHHTWHSVLHLCFSLIPFRTQGMCSSREEGSLTPLCISAAMTCWLLSQHVLHEGQKWDLRPQVFTECAENRQGKHRFMIWFCLFKLMMLRRIYVWTVTTWITQA